MKTLRIVELSARADAEALEARRRYAAVCREPAERWRPVADAGDVRHLAVDFFDPATGRYGQALGRWLVGGAWAQPPLGERPVLLVYDPPGSRRDRAERGYRIAYAFPSAGGGT